MKILALKMKTSILALKINTTKTKVRVVLNRQGSKFFKARIKMTILKK
jgi:hypothetical protein